MSDLYLRIPISDETTPVSGVVYHPVAEKKLLRGEPAEPMFLVVQYEYESLLHEICVALGWQGGTRAQALEEIARLRGNKH